MPHPTNHATTATDAAEEATRHLRGRTLILLSNREPYEHDRGGGEVIVRQPAGGLVSALDPTMRRTRGVWIAWGSGAADRETADADGRLLVPPDDPAYTLRRIWLDNADVDGFYLGFANSALWPLCHMLLQHFEFRSEHWERYREVNARFAAAAADEVRRAEGRPVVWVHDYHFALAPRLLRRQFASGGERPAAAPPFIHQFWHIPFPPPDILRLLPLGVYPAVLEGLLGNDLVEFHTERHALNFLHCVAEAVPAAVVDLDARRVFVDGRVVEVGAYPISIDVERYDAMARSPTAERLARELRERHARPSPAGDCQLGVSVDRVDYTKGIPERLRALECLWTESPELRGRITFLFVAPPSRSELGPYRALCEQVAASVEAINAKFGTDEWTPIIYLNEHVSGETLAGVYRAADLCLVSSLQDGMNLVAKEFVASQVDGCGTLVLSRFAGAAEDIDGAVLINPFNVDGFAAGIRTALAMPPEERTRRMRAMRARLRGATIFGWLDDIMSRVAALADDARSDAAGPSAASPPRKESAPPSHAQHARAPAAAGELPGR